jgi:hypothetical protein
MPSREIAITGDPAACGSSAPSSMPGGGEGEYLALLL